MMTLSMANFDVFRKVLLAIFVFSVMGIGAELLLLGHTAGGSQKIPLVLLVMSLLVLTWNAFDRGPASHRAFQITMLLFVAAGAAGLWLHGQADPAVDPPALAPAVMIQLGALGLAERWTRSL
jgi:hypothetical protein